MRAALGLLQLYGLFSVVNALPGLRAAKRFVPNSNAARDKSAVYGPKEARSTFPYTGAAYGLPGTGIGGILVPAAGDTAHAFVAPGKSISRSSKDMGY
jgi:hypothetical protein